MKISRIIKEIIKFFVFCLLAAFIGGIGIAAGIDAFSYRLFRDPFNLKLFLIDNIKFLIAYGIVYGIPEFLKHLKAKEVG